MQNKKGLELAISTLVMIIIGIVVLVAIILAVSGGFENLKSTTDPFLDTTQSSSVKQACTFACENADKLTFCCNEYEVDGEKIGCSDSRLEANCPANFCEGFVCNAPPSPN